MHDNIAQGDTMLLFYLTMIDTPEDKAKFEFLYTKYYKLLIDIALHILHNGEDAEDAVQQAFVKLIPNLGKIEDVTSRKTINYLVIMVKRICFDFFNEKKKIIQIPYEDLTEDELGTAEDTVLADIQFSELLQRVKALPDIYGDTLYLTLCEDFSPKDIADTFGITVKAAQKRIERAKQRLKAALSEEMANEF
jgi:RNA polymerase sigma-70 factor (ECF subfamily)